MKPSAQGFSQRQLRVSEHVRHALSEFFSRGELLDPLLSSAMISITEVRMSPDLKLAVCFFSALGVDDLVEVEKLLNKHARFIRGRVSSSLRQMKYMPSFRFLVDESFANFSKINDLLAQDSATRSEDDDTTDES